MNKPSSDDAPLILASRSPRRADLLRQIGVAFTTAPADIDERVARDEQPLDYVQRMAREKADKVATRLPHAVVLGADTSVVVDDRILGKPASATQGAAMLTRLAGRWHEVITAVSLRAPGLVLAAATRSRVRMRGVSAAEAAAYWTSGEPADKAGGYAIQGLGAVFVEAVDGSYSGVVGLPLCETAQLLAQAGIATGLQRHAA